MCAVGTMKHLVLLIISMVLEVFRLNASFVCFLGTGRTVNLTINTSTSS